MLDFPGSPPDAMRILHVISTTDPAYGGPVESVAQLGSYLKGLGVQVEVAACRDAPDAPWIPAYPLEVHAMGPAWGFYGYSSRLVPWLRARSGQYDLWIINGIWQYHASAAARVAHAHHVPYLVYTHGMLDPWSRRAHPIKYVKKFAYWSLFESHTLRRAAAVCFTAEEEAALARRYFPFGSWNSEVIGAGVAEPKQAIADRARHALDQFPELQGKRIWLFLGRLHPKKGLDLLLRAFAELAGRDASLHLLVVGEGAAPYVAAMRSLAQHLGISERVTFAGPLYAERKWAAYRIAELFVLPSHQENFAIVVAEALACGLPVCISDRVNIWREIAGANAGLVCKDSEISLRESLAHWVALSPDDRAAYRSAARKCYDANFHIRSAGQRLLRLAGEIGALKNPVSV